MKIGLDVSAGDFAPRVNLEAAIQIRQNVGEGLALYLFGKKNEILHELEILRAKSSEFTVVDCNDCISMDDHPIQALRQKPHSSMAIGLDYLKEGKIDAFASTGNTGAMMVGAIYKLNMVPGIIRPCISTLIPCINGQQTVLLDVGSNADCRVDVLVQFAELGAVYAQTILGIETPKIGLVNIGKEESKGNLVSQAAFKALKELRNINFVGNVEGRELFLNEVDVLVCDGFTGNIILKQAEGFYNLLKQRGIKDDYFEQFNYENYGGTPILGIKGNAIIGHGSSNANAVYSMLMHAYQVASHRLADRITNAIKE
ncbi:MAG: phosphate acyltransferase PlsX [Bacteroidetes bacterium]|nr:phosphate acyltransferase PlsX [Bacteroidota bacterium]